MYNKIRQSIKSCKLTGWSYQMDENKDGSLVYYLSKFDKRQKRNNDEYKVFFEVDEDKIMLTDAVVVREFKKKIELSLKNEHYNEAKLILRMLAMRQNKQFGEEKTHF